MDNGHTLGNHTYSHYNSYNTVSKQYVHDVEKADAILHSDLFRPPFGSLTLTSWIQLRKKYKIVFWTLNSNDFSGQQFNLEKSFMNLKKKTTAGDIILFHFCNKHENETKQLIPLYLKWLSENGFMSKGLAF